MSIYNREETDNGQLWIAMQFVDGTDADDALRAGTMTPQRALRIIGEVAKALDYAHQHRVVQAKTASRQPIARSEVSPYLGLGSDTDTRSWWWHVSKRRTTMAPRDFHASARANSSRESTALARPHPRRWWWVIATLSGVVLLAAGTVTALSMIGRSPRSDDTLQPSPTAAPSPTKPRPPPPTVPVSASPGLLLSAGDMIPIAGVSHPVVGTASSAAIDGPVPLAENECVSAWARAAG